MSTFNAISADTEKIDLKVIDDKQRIEADTVDYEDDFDEEIDDEIQVKQDSDEGKMSLFFFNVKYIFISHLMKYLYFVFY